MYISIYMYRYIYIKNVIFLLSLLEVKVLEMN